MYVYISYIILYILKYTDIYVHCISVYCKNLKCMLHVCPDKKNSLRKCCVYKNCDSVYIKYKYIYESSLCMCIQ